MNDVPQINDPAFDDLLALLRDAAVQRRLMRGWFDDLAFQAGNGTILYAVDMDVIRMFTGPREINARAPSLLAYGRVFGTDSDDVAEAVTLRLMDHIFFQLSGDWPLLVIPPIEEELDHYVSRLVVDHGSQPQARDVEIEELDQLFAKLELPADTISREAVQQAMTRIHEVLHFERHEQGEFRRIDLALSEGRLAGPDVEEFVNRVKDDDFIRATRRFEGITEVMPHFDRTQDWLERLRRVGHLGRTAQRDAAALARIEIWNQRLAPSNRRIVYLTGSRTLFDAGWTHKVHASATADDEAWFTDLYLRHPRALIAAPGILNTPTADPSAPFADAVSDDADGTFGGDYEFYNFLRTFLATFPSRGGDLLDPADRFHLAEHAKDVAAKTFEQQPQLGESFRRRWREFTEAMRPAYHPPATVQDRLLQMFQQLPGGVSAYRRWQMLEGKLLELLENGTRETWDRCFRMAIRTGLYFDLNNYTIPPRSVPPLNFDSWKVTHSFIETVSGWHSSDQVDVAAYDAGVAAVNKDDPTGYAHYLTHAALFAGRGKWEVAAVLAAKSLGLAKPAPRKPGQPNGREAAYLLSVCRRHAARSLQDLEGLDTLVEQAQAIMSEERGEGPFEAIPERFDGELLAIQMTRLMFARFGVDDGTPSPSDQHWRTARDLLAEDIAQLVRHIDGRIAGAQSDADAAADHAARGPSRLAQTLRKVHLRMLTNVVSLWLVDTTPSDLKRNTTFLDATRKLLAYQTGTEEGGPEVSFFVNVVIDCAVLLSELDPMSRRARRTKLNRALSVKSINDNRVFPYDGPRLRHFRELVLG